MNLVARAGNGGAGIALRVFAQGPDDQGDVLGAELEVEVNGCLPMIFDDGGESKSGRMVSDRVSGLMRRVHG